MDQRLDRDAWLRAARQALLRHGPSGVRVELLARTLKVTKGSFYWHFRDRQDLLDSLLQEWEDEVDAIFEGLAPLDRDAAVLALLSRLEALADSSERGRTPSDAAMFAWAAVDRGRVRRRVDRGEARRIQMFRELSGSPDLAVLLYYAYYGFLLRRRRVPTAAADFPLLQQLALALLGVSDRRLPPGVSDEAARLVSPDVRRGLRRLAKDANRHRRNLGGRG